MIFIFYFFAQFTSEKFELDESKIGGNASAEEVCEGAEDVTVSGIDVVINGKLQKTHWLYNEKNKLDRKQVLSQLKEYFKKYVIHTHPLLDGYCRFKLKVHFLLSQSTIQYVFVWFSLQLFD